MVWTPDFSGALRRLVQRRDDLDVLASRYGSDKGTRRPKDHGYTRIYSRLFEPLRDRPLRLLEIGLLGRDRRAWDNVIDRDAGHSTGLRAPSLRMWLDYFQNASVVGFDINDFSGVRLQRCQIVRGDMGDRADLARLSPLAPFDIIIEDASHASHHQQIALGFLFQHLKPSGIYIIEDLNWQPGSLELTDIAKTRDLLRHATVDHSFAWDTLLPAEQTVLAQTVQSIRLYDSMSCRSALDAHDALAVITRAP